MLLTTSESAVDIKVLQLPFWAWFKAGIAFTLGAGLVTLIGQIVWWMFLANLIAGMARVLSHR